MSDLSLGFGDEQRLPDILPPESVGRGLPPTLGLEDPTSGIGDTSALGAGVAAQVPKLNLAAPPSGTAVADRTQSDKDYLASLPTMEKIGLAMQSFKAGFYGTASPIDTLLKTRRDKEKTDRDNLISTINILQKGTEILRKLPQGSLQRSAVADELGKVVGAKFAPLFAAAGTEHDSALMNALDVMGDKEVQGMIVKACSGAPDTEACYLKQMNDKDFADRAYKVVDSKRLGAITSKMRALSDSMKTQGKDTFTLADITTLNKDNALFSPEEMNTIGRNEAFWGDMGLKSTKTIQAAAETAAKLAERPASDRVVTRNIGGTEYLYDPEQAKDGKRLSANKDWVALGPAGKEKSNDLTEAQMMRIRREKTAYDNAQTFLAKFGIDESGKSSKPNIQNRMAEKAPPRPGASYVDANPAYDRVFVGRVKAALKATEAGDPYVREGIVNPNEEAAAAPKAEAPAKPAAAQPKAAPAKEPALPLPAKQADLIANKIYQTRRGRARWNGTAFEPL